MGSNEQSTSDYVYDLDSDIREISNMIKEEEELRLEKVLRYKTILQRMEIWLQLL